MVERLRGLEKKVGVRLEDAPSLEKLVKTLVRIAVVVLGAQRAMVLFDEAVSSRPPCLGQYGLEPETIWQDETLDANLLSRVLDRGESVFLLDAHQGGQPQPEAGMRSVICVPLFSADDRVAGLLYLDHQQPGAFDYQTREGASQVAVDFSKRYRELVGRPAESVAEPEVSEVGVGLRRSLLLSGVAMFLLASAVVTASMLVPAPAPAELAAPAPASTGGEQRKLATELLKTLQAERVDDAYLLLSERLRGQIRPGDLYTATASIENFADYRCLSVETRQQRSAARLGIPGPERGQIYRWELVAEADNWRVDSLGAMLP